MNVKHNSATRNRPAGERIIDAPALCIEMNSLIRQIRNEETWHKYDRNSITVFKTPEMRMVLGGLHKGAEMNHKAEGVMSIQVLDGMLEINTDDIAAHLKPMQVMAIHKGCNYSVLALQETIYLLTMSGVKQNGA